MTESKKFDVLTIGRSSIDLYSQNVGAEFVDIKGFDAFVGGSPLNIATGCSRLGLNAALLTAVGNDKVGDFILNFLNKEKVNTSFIPTIKGARSSAVLLGIQPPDKFPLIYYRDNAADSQLTPAHVQAIPIQDFKLVEISGTAFNKEPSRSAMLHAIQEGNQHHVDILLDLDFRADQWPDLLSFGAMIRSVLPKVNIVIGTEEEVLAAVLHDESQVSIQHQQVSAPVVKGDIKKAIDTLLTSGIETLIVKRGASGVTYYNSNGESEDVPGFPVEVLNVLGAGDAFASGFIYGYLKGWDLRKACRMGNASGAHVVTKPGCANFMPTLEESLKFIETHGGF